MDNTKLKTWPEQIYLQHGADELPDYADVRHSQELSWCAGVIHESDVHYIRADLAERAASNPASPALQEDFETWAKAENYDMDARDGAYESLLTAAAWEAFQAARRAASPAPVAAITDERAAFEHYERASELSRDDDYPADYANPYVQSAWEAWQARAALSSAPMAQAVAWIATDLDGRADVGLTKEVAKRRAGESCNEFIPLFDVPALAATPAVPAAPSERELGALNDELQNQRELVQHWKGKAILGADYQDAKRYRWLRNHDPSVPREIDVCTDEMVVMEGIELDAMIDAAMSGAAPAAPIERENG